VHFKGIFRLGLVLVASVALVSGAGTTAAKSGTRIDVSTRASIVHYLRSIHVNPKGVVIQRGLRNYAGPSCPGRAWRCARTLHAVVQIARPGGMNRFLCRTARCAVLQVAEAASRNSATCIKTTGLGASCSITQSNSAGNTALIWEDAGKLTGLTQTAVYSASIVQQSASGANLACVHQSIFIDGSTTNTRSAGATVTLEAHQSIFVKQDSTSGSNTAENAANPSTGVYTCASTAVSQDQKLTSTATSRGVVTQNENAAQSPCPDGVSGDNANMCLDIEQNQSTGFKGSASGANSATFVQTNSLSATANSPTGVTQTQSSVNPSGPGGGLVGTVNQDSSGLSTATATQSETQCEDAAKTGLTKDQCDPSDPDFAEAPSSLTQNQYGPVGLAKFSHKRRGRHFYKTLKGLGTATQTGNPGDMFTINQSSTQNNDQGSGSTQTNTVQGDCSTPGNCTDTQTVTVNGQTTTNTQTGQNFNAQTTCSGSTCTTTNVQGATVGSGNVLVSVGDGLIQVWDVSGAAPVLVHTLNTGKGSGSLTAGLAFDSSGRLYSADFSSSSTPSGDVSQFNADGTLAGSFGSGYNQHPESIVFDSSGNAYVGQADGTMQVLEFDASGNPVTSFSPATEDRGTDWIDLAPDGCTLYYTSEGHSVKTFDVCANEGAGTQGADFATGLPGAAAYAIKLLPDGGALVADSDRIVRLNSSGTVVQTYGLNAGAQWFSLTLDPSGTSFWAGDLSSGEVEEFNLSSGAVLASFNTGDAGSGDAAGGLAVGP